jgi:hypothetical protein
MWMGWLQLRLRGVGVKEGRRGQVSHFPSATIVLVPKGFEAVRGVESKRRITEIENGTAKLIPAEEIFAEVPRMIE